MRVSRSLAAIISLLVLVGPASAEGGAAAPLPATVVTPVDRPAGPEAPVTAAPNTTAPAATPVPTAAVPPASAPAPAASGPTPTPAFSITTATTPFAAAPAGTPAVIPADTAMTVDPAAASNAGSHAPSAANTEPAAAPPPPPEPTLTIDIDLSTQRMTVTENGDARYTWAISSAAAGYRTPTGTFKPAWMARMWYSRQYDWSPMPHAIFFHRGVAIHATQALRQLGRPASHGCVRLAPGNAATLYKMVGRHGKDMTRISVHGTPRHPAVSYRSSGPRYGYGQRRGPAGATAYYGAPNAYYVPAPRRRGSARVVTAPPRRYVSRGLFSPY
ncbi:MAG: L,D-transpeptidase [Hyphomicrobium sp.]